MLGTAQRLTKSVNFFPFPFNEAICEKSIKARFLLFSDIYLFITS